MSDIGQAAALSGLRVLEIAHGAYAWCGKLLAEMGAEVIKIEPPGGEPSRLVPPYWGDRPGPASSLEFLYFNTSKRSITLDLSTDGGQARLRELAAASDVLIETLAPGVMAACGLSWEALQAVNPALVYTSITGFGQHGPHAQYRATDVVVAAMGGAMIATGHPQDPPVVLAGAQSGVVAATLAACSTLVALRHRWRCGRGQHVDISAQEAMLSASSICGVGKWLQDGIIPVRYGNALFSAVPSGTYPCEDGSIYLIINRPRHWQVLARWVCEVTGNREILDPMFEGPSSARQPYRELLDLFLREFTGRFTVESLYRQGQARHLAVTPLNTARGVVADAHLAARSFFCDVDHGGGRRLRYPGPPFRLSATPWRLRHGAPGPGADDALMDSLRAPRGSSAEAARDGPAVPAGGPLAGLRVVEFTAGMAGPWIGRIMAWCGADVIKVESRDFPDVTRLFVPPRQPELGIQPQLSPWFTDWNAGKRFVALDLTQPRGVALAGRLVAASDVVIDNNGNGVLEKLGLGFAELRRLAPRAILLSSTGYGRFGPDAGYISWGPNIETLSGLATVSGFAHRDCTMTQFAYPDPLSALHGLFAILCALEHRRSTARGQVINLSQTEVTAAAIGAVLMEVLANDREPARRGNASLVYSPQGVYPCLGDDRWCALSVCDQAQWLALCGLLGRPGLAADVRFAEPAARLVHQAALDEIVAAWTAGRDAHEAMHCLQAAGIPAGVVQNTEDQYRRDPHLAARGYFETIAHPLRGSVVAPGIPLGLTGSPGGTSDTGRPVGGDNRAVCCGLLGLSADEYRELVDAGVIQ